MFDQKGQIVIDKEEYEGDADELMMAALDAGAEDFVEEEDSFEILTGAGRLRKRPSGAGRGGDYHGGCGSDHDPADLCGTDR